MQRFRQAQMLKQCLRARVSNRIRRASAAMFSDLGRREELAYRDLREFVRKLEKEGELKRVRTEVDPNLEITEIVQRVGRSLGHGPGGGRGLRGQSGQPGMAVPQDRKSVV